MMEFGEWFARRRRLRRQCLLAAIEVTRATTWRRRAIFKLVKQTRNMKLGAALAAALGAAASRTGRGGGGKLIDHEDKEIEWNARDK